MNIRDKKKRGRLSWHPISLKWSHEYHLKDSHSWFPKINNNTNTLYPTNKQGGYKISAKPPTIAQSDSNIIFHSAAIVTILHLWRLLFQSKYHRFIYYIQSSPAITVCWLNLSGESTSVLRNRHKYVKYKMYDVKLNFWKTELSYIQNTNRSQRKSFFSWYVMSLKLIEGEQFLPLLTIRSFLPCSCTCIQMRE
jgi:hypothetical protein